MNANIHKNYTEASSERYLKIRAQSLALCAPLKIEDYQIQPMDDASPPKWHLAHTTWFFETFLLKRYLKNYTPFNDAFEVLFNSYYNGVGELFPRKNRGFLSRPTVAEIILYREYVDQHIIDLLAGSQTEQIGFCLELGINHEQQHQELLVTDLKYNFGNNPLKPAYMEEQPSLGVAISPSWILFEGGLTEIGRNEEEEGFSFDNEKPRHTVYLEPYELASHLVTNREYIEFIEDGGYERYELWLSDGWSHLKSLYADRWTAPLYWRKEGGTYLSYTLSGEREVDANSPVCHVSAYEADAFARWRGCRLASEAEWEVASETVGSTSGNFVENGFYHPRAAQNILQASSLSNPKTSDHSGLQQMFGDVWEWTKSAYGAYPGFKQFTGQLGEYNGKFMANQLVLRGGSCVTPLDHIRHTYRNFFYPPDRWQFSGIRLAKNLS